MNNIEIYQKIERVKKSNVIPPSPPLFKNDQTWGNTGGILLGHPRSGTNYLKALLAANPLIFSLNEPFSLHFKHFLDNDCSIWSSDDYNEEFLHEKLKGDTHTIVKLKKLQKALKEKRLDSVRLIKETTFLTQLEWFHKYLGVDLPIIFLTRNPYAVISSFKKSRLFRKWGYGSRYDRLKKSCKESARAYMPLFELADKFESEEAKLAVIWIIRNSEAILKLNALYNYKLVRYEDLIDDTDTQIRDIMDFIGLDVHPNQQSLISKSQKGVKGINRYSSFRKKEEQMSLVDKYLNNTDVKTIMEIIDCGEDIMYELGIDVENTFNTFIKKPSKNRALLRKYNSQECFKQNPDEIRKLMESNAFLVDEMKVSQVPITNQQFCSFLNYNSIENEVDGSYLFINTFGERCRIKKLNGKYCVEKGYEKHPVTHVNWHGANEFCKWINGELPSIGLAKRIIEAIDVSKLDFEQVNIEENVGKIWSIEKITNENPVYNFIGNVWKWVGAEENELMATEFGGAFNSPSTDWNRFNLRIKDYGASNTSFHVVL